VANILIVDDSSLVRNVFKRQLEKIGHACTVAGDGSEALQILIGKQHFDLMITDIVMRDVGGIETIRAVRAMDKSMPIIAITGSPEPTDKERADRPLDALKLARALGATKTIRKPFSAEQLIKLVEECVGPPADVAAL
jgi:CheY-like chemotaxis protein